MRELPVNGLPFLRVTLFRLLLLASLAIAGHAQERAIKTYTTADGLGHNRVKNILRDSNGFLWFCTSGGLSRFDGAHFVNFGLEDGLPFQSINDLLELPDGTYWIATNGNGLIRFTPGIGLRPATPAAARLRFREVRLGADPASERVNAMLRRASGELWLGTDGGLFRLTESRGATTVERIELRLPGHPDPIVQINALVEDGGGSLWIGSRFGLLRRLPDGRIVHYPIASSDSTDAIMAVLLDGEGRVWIGHQDGLLVFQPDAADACRARADSAGGPCVEPLLLRPPSGGDLPAKAGDARQYTTADGLVNNAVMALYRFADGRILLGAARDGLTEFAQGRFRPFLADGRLRESQVSAIREDDAGNLWIATLATGLRKVARRGFLTWRRSDGLGGSVSGVFEDPDGRLFATSDGWRVSRYDDGRWTTIRLNLPAAVSDLSWRATKSVLRDREGEWWAATGAGLYRFAAVARLEELARARPKAVYTKRDGLADENLTRLYEDARGDLWIASFAPSREVLTRWERATGRFYRYGEADGLAAFNAPTYFSEDREGTLWISFRDGGVARYRDGRFRFTRELGGATLVGAEFFLLDDAGRFWYPNGVYGLCRVDAPASATARARSYDVKDGLSSVSINRLQADANGNLYIGTPKGVDRLDPASGKVRHYTPDDGLAGTELAVIHRDRRGALWFGSTRGLSQFTPDGDASLAPPPVRISALRIAGVDYLLSALGEAAVATSQLGPQQNQLQIDYFGIGFASGEALRYEVKLAEADRDWQPASPVRTINYSNLAPGEYRFLVRAVSADGLRSPTPASVSFEVLPPFWRRWWFRVAALLLLGGGLAAFERYRAARVRDLDRALGESRSLTEELSRQRAELRLANRTLEIEAAVTDVLVEAATPTQAAPRILKELCERLDWEIGAIWNADPASRVLRCVDIWSRRGTAALSFEADTRHHLFLPGEGLPGRVLTSGTPHWIEDIARETDFPRVATASKEGLRSGFGFPILLGSEVIGVLEFFSREFRPADPEQIQTVSAIGSHIGQLIERKRVEEARHESETRFRTVAETASDAIITVDARGAIVFVNPAAEKVFGYASEAMIGADLTMLMPEYLRHVHQAGFARYQQTGKRHLSWQAIELPGLHSDGRELPLEISFGEFRHLGQHYFTGIARDITERKRAEEALRKAREERLQELERVRRRIATDLHDDIGSSLTQISILSEVLRQRIGSTEAAANEPLSMIASASRELIDSMSDIVWAINPQKDHLQDLTQRMRRFAADSFTGRGIRFRLQLAGAEEDIKMGANLRREVFLIFKECVNNIVKHASCAQVEIEFSVTGTSLRLSLRDDGCGFDLSRESEGHGLASMRDRARGIGGALRFDSRPGEGTQAELIVPLDAPLP